MTVYVVATVAEGDQPLEQRLKARAFFTDLSAAESSRTRSDATAGNVRKYRLFEMKSLATIEVLQTLAVERTPMKGVIQPPAGPRIYAVGAPNITAVQVDPELATWFPEGQDRTSATYGYRWEYPFLVQSFSKTIRDAESKRRSEQMNYGEEDSIWLEIREQIVVAEIVVSDDMLITRIPNETYPVQAAA